MALTARQNEIIDAAIQLIAAGGIQALTLKKLARAIGVTEPALYRHFNGKSEIVRSMIRRFDESFQPEECHQKGFDAIRAFVETRMEQVLAQPALAKVIFTEDFFLDDPDFTEEMHAMMLRHRTWVEQQLAEWRQNGALRPSVDPDILFRLIMGPVRLLFKQWGMSGMNFDLRQQCQSMLDAMEKLLEEAK